MESPEIIESVVVKEEPCLAEQAIEQPKYNFTEKYTIKYLDHSPEDYSEKQKIEITEYYHDKDASDSSSAIYLSEHQAGNGGTDSTADTGSGSAKKKENSITYQQRLDRRREQQRERRARMKENPVEYTAYLEKERERYHRRVEEGKIKLVPDMSDRERKTHRRRCAEYKRNLRQSKKSLLNTVNDIKYSPNTDNNNYDVEMVKSEESDRQVKTSKEIVTQKVLHQAISDVKVAQMRRKLCYKNNKKLRSQIAEQDMKIKQLYKKLNRLTKQNEALTELLYKKACTNNPQSNVKEFLNERNIPKIIDRLVFCDVKKEHLNISEHNVEDLAE